MAIGPGLETREDWEQWLRNPVAIDVPLGKIDLAAVPAMLRRRFSKLGKCAMGAAMPLVDDIAEIPSIFASRHGDTPLSLTLLEGIARDEPMSPTNFSLAVHNAISGLFSIVRKDSSAVTAIAAMEGLVLQTLFEVVGQLQTCDRLLCVIYDIPLPDFYQAHRDEAAETFPHAIAMVIGNNLGKKYRLQSCEPSTQVEVSGQEFFTLELLCLLRLLAGIDDQVDFVQQQSGWRLARVVP
jgi:hypothetical protein